MAGWIAVWSRDGAAPDALSWTRSKQAAVRYGGRLTELVGPRVALAAWRREQGEFPLSGTLAPCAGAQLAWVGQCVDDGGDASGAAMAAAAAPAFDAAAMAAVNGPFAAAVYREAPFEVRLLTDRYRHYPIYLYRGPTRVVASTEMRCLLPWIASPRIASDSVDMLLRSGELIERMTMLEGVELVEPGTVVSDTGGGPVERRYWTLRHDGSAAATIGATADALAGALTTAVRRLERVSPRLGITLSGGLDSRIVLDLCRQPAKVPSFTWGLPGCRDITCAAEYSALVGSPHTVKHWVPEAFPALWSRGVDLTAGSCGIESMYMLPFVPLLGRSCDVILNGLAGDAILGGNFLKSAWLRETDPMALGRAVWRWRVAPSQDAAVDRLTGRGAGDSSSAQRWAASIAARSGARPVERLNDWLYENRVFRNTNCGTMLLRAGIESHAPFFDRDFIDAVLGARFEDKVKHRLYLEVMKRAAPRAASVRWQRTNLAPARGYMLNLAAMAVQRAVTQAASPLGIHPFAALKVADPAAWLRGPWRREVEAHIIDGRLAQRSLVNPDAVREIWRAHLDGADHARQIGVLVAIESFARLTLDGAAA